MIEPTEQMIHDIRNRIGGSEIAARSAAEAVLAHIMPACGQPHPAEDGVRCQLPPNHGGSHSATVTRELWWFARATDGTP